MRDWNKFFTAGELFLMPHEQWRGDQGLADILNAKIREAIEAAPKMKFVLREGEQIWHSDHKDGNTHTARIIDVKPIEKDGE